MNGITQLNPKSSATAENNIVYTVSPATTSGK